MNPDDPWTIPPELSPLAKACLAFHEHATMETMGALFKAWTLDHWINGSRHLFRQIVLLCTGV